MQVCTDNMQLSYVFHLYQLSLTRHLPTWKVSTVEVDLITSGRHLVSYKSSYYGLQQTAACPDIQNLGALFFLVCQEGRSRTDPKVRAARARSTRMVKWPQRDSEGHRD